MGIVITVDGIIKVASVITALGVFAAIFKKILGFAKMEEDQEKRISKIEENQHNTDKELSIITYGVLACLRGLREQGCNGAVSKGITDIEEYLNAKAHNEV